MEVKSKFNKGDTIFFMMGEVPAKGEITGISFFIGSKKAITGEYYTSADVMVTYHVDHSTDVPEKKAFGSKDDLLKGVFAEL